MRKEKIIFLSAEDIRNLVSMKEAIDAVESAFLQLSSGKAVVPMRTTINIQEKDATSLIMPAYLPEENQISLKLINLYNQNPEKGLPLAYSLVILADGETGKPLAVMDGGSLTAIRTGAASGVATKYLAREDSSVAAVFGAGVQGRTQLEALCNVRDIKKAYVFDISKEKAKTFAEEMGKKLSIPVYVADSYSVLQEVDILSTATTSKEPVFSPEFIRPGTHINAVGSYKPSGREIPEEIVSKAKLVVDHRESCLEEAGDILIPIKKGLFDESHIFAEIGEIIAREKPARENREEITFFKSVGNAVQDLVTAKIAYEKALRTSTGFTITL